MDPFNIAQLILLSGEIISACYIYGCAVSNSPEDLRKLVEETTSLSGIFVAIQGLVNADRFVATQKEALSNSLKECQVTLRQLKDILQSIHPRPDEKKMKGLTRFLWPLKQNETTKILERLGRHKSSLNLLLTLEATLEAQQTQIVLYELQDALQDDREERKGREIVGRRIQVNQWLCEDTVSYGFMEFQDQANSIDDCRPESVIGAIILQICQVLNFLPEHVEDSYTRHIGKDGKAAAPSFQELEVLLSETLALVPNVTIVVDALDECHERESLVKILSDLPSNASASVKVLVSSRREVDIVRLLKDHPSISTQCQDADEDIHHYIRASIKLRPRLQRLNGALQEHIVETLTKGAGGMFRWVKCQLDELARLRTDGAIKSALCGLPRDLDETYERILGRISEHDIPLARQALLWLAYASRPLTLSELAEGAILQPNVTILDPEDRLHDPEDILEVCSSLVSLDGPYVVLAHNSVRDYLLSSCAANNLPRFYLPESHCLPELSTLCLTYLMLSPFSTGPCVTSEDMIQRLKDWPLLQYISHNWADHARPYLTPSQNPALYIQVTTLFADPPTANFLSWVQILFVNPRRLQKTYNLYPRTGTPLYYATSFALTSVFEHLLAQGSDVNAQGGRGGGTPLHAACWRVQVELIRLLLRSGANLDVRDKNGETAVDLAESAMAAGNVEIAGVFLDERGIVLNNQNGRDAGDWWDNVNGNIRKYRLKWKPRVIR
ncbi:predicted protein [Histoplasma mississippiense (nom. inval.)]|uniref:predicted protein n=1 Tax=Ajellomyces capsulatus (strain NAm1 / WU24) TaxID=2059318 RepID=UPI000157CF1F|nr:predicted protein [Histoplasma mississippiense (nom. inval.)]EDN11170.1 predicted protein [Histoplasma mississippiense (nom. inval.)]